MEAVTDKLHISAGIQSRTHKTGVTVMEGLHAVEKMSDMAGAGLEALHGCIIISGAVAQRNSADVLGLADKVDCAVNLGGNGDELYTAAAYLIETAEHFNIGPLQCFGLLGAALGIAEEGAFKMNAGKLCAVIRALIAAHDMHLPLQLLPGDGHGCKEP